MIFKTGFVRIMSVDGVGGSKRLDPLLDRCAPGGRFSDNQRLVPVKPGNPLIFFKTTSCADPP
jgi:hypothetical protein